LVYFVGDKGCQVFFAARAAIEALAGDGKVLSSLGFILFLISTGTTAAAEYDQQVQSRGIRWRNLDVLPATRQFADLRGQ
jgi:uncharacterized transporter YbjL